MSCSDHPPPYFKGFVKSLCRIWPVLPLIFLALLAAFSYQRFQLLERQHAQFEQELQILRDDAKAASKEAAKTAKVQSEAIEKLQASLAATETAIKGLEMGLIRLQTDTRVLSSKVSYVADFIIGQIDESSSKPLPFSYFLGGEWNNEMANIRQQLSDAHLAADVMDGQAGEDTFSYSAIGDLVVDGQTLKSLEIYNIRNGVSNTVTVLAPGLMRLEKDTLTIAGDKRVDDVVLDGCLAWNLEPEQDGDGYKAWKGMDINGEARIVRISDGIPSKIKDKCNHRYLDRYKTLLLSALLKDLQTEVAVHSVPSRSMPSGVPNSAQSIPLPLVQTSFGGVGLTFTNKDENVTGMEITGVLEGKPAQKAGLKPHDNIVKIDGEPVSGMNRNDAIAKMRGDIGSLLKLTYIPAGQGADKAKEVTLTRELIDLSRQPGQHRPSAPEKRQLAWDTRDADTRFIITQTSALTGSDTRTFKIRNTSQSPAKLPNLHVTDITGTPKKTWAILPESTCLKGDIAPNADCTVIVRAQPDMDGQMEGYIQLYGRDIGRQDDTTSLSLSGYARGISGRLPEKVIGNGDRCPIAGERAEIAVSATSGFRGNDGYFETRRGVESDNLRLFTAECLSWESREQEHLSCNNPGKGSHSATLREYQSEGTNGPWKQSRIKERYISATLTCRDGLIDQVKWSW